MRKGGAVTVTDLSGTSDATTPRSPPTLALVIASCVEEPERTGEIGFIALFATLFVGRGDEEEGGESDEDLRFGRQLPGEGPPSGSRARYLRGGTISRRQLDVRATVEGLMVTRLGKLDTFVNGELLTKGERRLLKPGGIVLLKGQVALLCVRRPSTLPALRALRAVQPFGEPDAGDFVGESVAAWKVRDEAAIAAETEDHVLIQGESGTGKELVSALVHKLSKRGDRPLVDHDASSFADSLKESTLCGNEKGYPDRLNDMRPGLFGQADGSILFLDEIGECPHSVQAQLLRTMQTGRYTRLGASTARTTDVRVIGATNQSDESLRPELRARFVSRIWVPPLRERPEDIALILRQLARVRAKKQPRIATQFCDVSASGALFPRFDPQLVDYVVRQALPHNARELLGILAVALANSPGNVILMPPLSELPMPASERAPVTARSGPPSSVTRAKDGEAQSDEDEAAKAERVRGVLESVGWNLTRGADVLGMDRTTLRRFTVKHGLGRDGGEP
jgi:DNA-binding NtrC family response regulator